MPPDASTSHEPPHTDPRMEAVSDALMGTQKSWVTVKDSTVVVDLEEVSRIAVFAVESIDSDDPDYCKWMCHTDEQERIVEILTEVWKATNGQAELLSLIVDMIEIPDGLIMGSAPDDQDSEESDAS